MRLMRRFVYFDFRLSIDISIVRSAEAAEDSQLQEALVPAHQVNGVGVRDIEVAAAGPIRVATLGTMEAGLQPPPLEYNFVLTYRIAISASMILTARLTITIIRIDIDRPRPEV